MKRASRWLVAVAVLGTTIALSAPRGSIATETVPRWIKHIQKYSGGISNGVREMVSLDAQRVGRPSRAPAQISRIHSNISGLHNVQMNTQMYPPMPQNETAVAYNTSKPLNAVAAANDYVSGGNVVMRTFDGGNHWATIRLNPQFRGTADFCTGGDPAVAYSSRDHAFYMTQLCFFRAEPYSEVHLYKSLDGGKTWTPGRQRALVATNFDYSSGEVDPSIFHDKEYLTVDNYPNSPHYGRIYVTWTKFHIQPDGFSDYCPIQLAYTDNVPTTNPALTTFQYSQVVPDNPGGDGKGESADQFSVPVVEKNGDLDISYVLEDCNTSDDFGLRFQKSTDGGASFLPQPVTVDHPGEWADNPTPLPNKKFRAPASLAYSRKTGTLIYVEQNYIDGANSGSNISYWLSHDGGMTWSPAKTLSVDKNGNPAPNDQFFAWVAAAPNGTFHAIWLDNRLDPGNKWIDTWQATSTNDGQTWSSRRISSESWNPDWGFFVSASFIGDYSGLAAANHVVYPVWVDGRNTKFFETGIGNTNIETNVEIGN
jgi:BNR/Asp-box repeat